MLTCKVGIVVGLSTTLPNNLQQVDHSGSEKDFMEWNSSRKKVIV